MSDLDQVTLNAGDKSVVLPVIKPTLGNDCVDIAKLTKETGYFTYDSGFTATASCKSAITYIDGDKGVLLYRGYPIEQLSEKSSYVEVAYLLINGERPSAEQLKAFTDELTAEANVDESINTLIGSFARMPTRWPSWPLRSRSCRPSITTRWTCPTPNSAAKPPCA